MRILPIGQFLGLRRNSSSPSYSLRRELLQGLYKVRLFQPPQAEVRALTVCAIQVQRSPVAFLPGWDKVQDESDSPTFQLIIVAQQDICNYTHFAAVAPFQYAHDSFRWLPPSFVLARIQEKTCPVPRTAFSPVSIASPRSARLISVGLLHYRRISQQL